MEGSPVPYVLDTTVLSELLPTGKALSVGLFDWLFKNLPESYISTISIMELQYGVSLLELKDTEASGLKAKQLRVWHKYLYSFFDDRIIQIDDPLMKKAGHLRAVAGRSFGEIGVTDSVIAASAFEKGCPVVTRNRRHFEATGVSVIDTGVFDQSGLVMPKSANLRLIGLTP